MDESLEANQPRGVKDLEPDRFWLAVGTLEPRKNLRRLLKSFADYADQTETAYPLALAGGKGWLEEDLVDYICKLGLSDRVHILGYVSDSELIWLYRNCFCFVYPSLYEGFGLPVLEAMGQGAPVITSSTTSLPEVAGDAAHLIDPLDTNGLTEAFKRLSSDKGYREGLRKKSLMQAKRFSWNKSSSDVLNIYQRVMALSK